jgi:cobalt-zinc-cadmium efflux system protein
MINPEPVKGIEMLMVALVGLVANGASFLLLARVSRHDINLKSAFMHVVFDTASSVAVVASAIVIEFTGFMLLDPIVSSGIGVLILVWCINLIRDSVNILLEATPRDVDIRDLSREVEEIAHVKHIHDIHVWQITSNMYVMTAHVVLDDLHLSETQHIIEKINRVLQQRHRIGHTTLQVEVDSDSGRVEMAPRENIKDGPTRNNGTSH